MKQNKKFSHKWIHPKHFWVSGIKIINVVTNETSQINIAADTVAFMENLVSLWGDSFTDVGLISVKLKRFSVGLIDIIVYFELV